MIGLIVLIWPYRREWRCRACRVIAAPPGTVWRTIQSFGTEGASWALLALTGSAIVGLGFIGYYLVAAILAIGALQAWHLRTGRSAALPLAAPEFAAIVLGYGATIAVHFGVVVLGAPYLGLNIA